MTRLPFSIILLLFATTFFGQKGDTLLSRAYKTKSLSELQSFFDNWANETSAISSDDIGKLDDTAKNIYQVFESFYNPKDITRTGGSEWGNEIYKNVKYLLIQDKIYYAIIDTLMNNYPNDTVELKKWTVIYPRAKKYDTLRNFRPLLAFSNVKCVTLTKYYTDLLNYFLGDKHYKLGTESIMSPARSTGESQKRMQFLENYIKIWYGHWGGYWQLHSYPFATRITFDKNFQNAIVDYRMVYEGGYAFFRKIGNKWTLLKAERTWIE